MSNGSAAEAQDGHASDGNLDRRADPVKVAIVGTGNVGSALARTVSSAGHDVIVTATTPSEAEALAKEVGGQSLGSNVDAIRAAGIVILAVPHEAIASIVVEVGDDLDDKILVDAGPLIGPDPRGDGGPEHLSEHAGRLLAECLEADRARRLTARRLTADRDVGRLSGRRSLGLLVRADAGRSASTWIRAPHASDRCILRWYETPGGR